MVRKAEFVEIGARLKEKREQAGYTRERLAELVGMSARSISNYEMGDNGLSMDTLKKVCLILGTTTDFVLYGNAERDISSITVALNNIDEKHHRYLDAIVRAYLEACFNED